MTMQHFLFSPVDSWFFRESRSMDGSGATALESIFPPANNTLLGAIRTLVGNIYHDSHGTTWQDFKNNQELQKIIGFGNDYAQLQAQGAWLYNASKKKIYLPSPLNLLKQGDDYTYFKWGSPCQCDLGLNVTLPELPKYENSERPSPIESSYISSEDYNQILQGNAPKEIVEQTKIFDSESRLGIERDNHRRKTKDGKLYQTKHVRLRKDWQLYLGLKGLNDYNRPPETILRLGGEARMAALSTLDRPPELPEKPKANQNTEYLLIYLITPLPDIRTAGNQAILPTADFEKIEESNQTLWRGKINGIELDIISAVVGKVQRMGGWDMVNNQSLPVRSFIPAGSCWHIKTNGNAQAIIDTLHGQHISEHNDKALGYGQIIVGLPSQS